MIKYEKNNKFGQVFVYGVIASLIMYFVPSMRTESSVNQEAGIDYFLGVNLVLLFFTGSLGVLYSKKNCTPVQLKTGIYLIILSILISSIFATEIQYTTSCKFLVFLLLPYYFIQAIDNSSLNKVIILLIFVCFCLTVFGFYGYITGNIGLESQAFWWYYAKYWGIHYLESTRNSDVYIPAVAFSFLLPFVFEKTKFYEKICINIAIVTFLSAVILSLSRGSWISITVVILCYAVYFNKMTINSQSNKIIFVVLLSTLVAITLSVAVNFGESKYIKDKLTSIYKFDNVDSSISSNKERTVILLATVDIIKNNPFGVGLDNLRYHYPSYGLNINHAENNYLNIIAELGLIGFAGFFIVVFYPLKTFYNKLVANPDKLNLSIFLASLYVSLAYFFNVATFGIFVWIIHALSWSLISIGAQKG